MHNGPPRLIPTQVSRKRKTAEGSYSTPKKIREFDSPSNLTSSPALSTTKSDLSTQDQSSVLDSSAACTPDRSVLHRVGTPSSRLSLNSSWRNNYSTPPPARRSNSSFLGNFSPSIFSSPVLSPGLPHPVYDVTLSPRRRRIAKTQNCAECSICSDEVYQVLHPHFSTQSQQANLRGNEIYCKLCRRKHQKDSSRLNLVLSSSTVHNLWQNPSYKPDQHIDFDTIIGGRIHDIHASFLYQYSEVSTPLDVLLVCGVNNVPTEDTPEIMIRQYESLIKTIKRHSEIHHHKVPNRVVLCTVLYSPKHCDDRLQPHLNMTQKVRRVNEWINEFNKKETGLELKLHLNGVIGDPDNEKLVFNYDEWREPMWNKKLHLTNEVKDRVASQVIQLFRDMKAQDQH